MAPSLIVTIHLPDRPARTIELDRDACTLGRSPENDIVIDSPLISRRHARLERMGAEWVYEDLGSRNGTRGEGQRIQRVTLTNQLRLQVGENPANLVVLSFQIPAAPTTTDDGPIRTTAEQDVRVDTIMEKKESVTGFVPLTPLFPPSPAQKTLILGRSSDADIRLQAPSVSRRHALLSPAGDEWTLEDLNSSNGTFVNGRRINGPVKLHAGDRIQAGPFRLEYQGQGRVQVFSSSRGLRLDGQDLTVEVTSDGKRKQILKNVTLSCYPQEFIGLVGGSGAGKSTLMKALSGLMHSKGRVLVEGEDLYQNFDAYRSQIGYVPQDDILHKELSVEQALRYSARLRLPGDIGDQEVESRVTKVLEQVELSGQRGQTIQSLSGGQRKRASIAVELLADPPLFFLDEPTSGLDPGLEKKMMVMLGKLAREGKTIMLVTHATANITECDQVAFLSQGRMVFFGPPRQAGEFFDVGPENFADIYDEISAPTPQQAEARASSWEERFKASTFHQTFVRDRVRTISAPQGRQRNTSPGARTNRRANPRINPWMQFVLLARRYFDLILRDRTLLTILLAIMPLLAILILGIAESNWLTGDTPEAISRILGGEMSSGAKSASYFASGGGQKLLFIMALTSVMLGLFSSAYEIVKERTIYERERMVFLQLIPYLASKIIPLAAFASIQCFLFLLVIGLKVRFPFMGTFLPFFIEAYLTLFLAVLTAICLGLFISALARNQNAVTYVILGILFLQITFAGVIFELPGATRLLSSLTLTRWTMQALGASVDLERLDALSRTRFQPGPLTQEVEVEVEKPDPNWQPVTVVTQPQQVPGCAEPVPMPSVVENEMVTVTEKIRRTVTIEKPDPLEIHTPYGFTLDYASSPWNLLANWAMLAGLCLLFSGGTLFVLKQRDIF